MKRFLQLVSVSTALSIAVLISGSATAQSLQTSHVELASEATTTAPSSPSAGPIVLYDQTATPGGNGAPGQEFPDFGGSHLESADDFEVPTGETWDIMSITALGSYSAAGGWVDWGIEIFEVDGSNLPGSMVFQELGITDVTDVAGDVEVTLTTPATISEGHYFLVVRVNMDFSTDGQWFWTTNTTPSGLERVFQDPDDLLATGTCLTWMPGATVCGTGGGVDLDLSFAISGAMASSSEAGSELPSSVTLGQSYPNPFNPSATIPFEVSETSDVRIAVYDVLGREVVQVVNQTYTPGAYTVSFDAIGLPSGTYMYRLEANGGVQMRTMSLLK